LDDRRRRRRLAADDRESQLGRRLDLRAEVRGVLLVREEAVGADREVGVDREARRLEAVLLDHAAEAGGELVGYAREVANALEADDFEAGPHAERCRLGDQLLDAVPAGVELRREAVERDAQLRTAHRASRLLTQRSRITSRRPASMMYGIRTL